MAWFSGRGREAPYVVAAEVDIHRIFHILWINVYYYNST